MTRNRVLEFSSEPDPTLLYRAIVETTDDAILTKSPEGRITSWNPAAERLYGYSAKEAIGQNIRFIVPSEKFDELNGILKRINRGERISHFETVRLAKNGGRIDVSLTVSPLTLPTGKVFMATSIERDISELRRAESRLEKVIEFCPSAWS